MLDEYPETLISVEWHSAGYTPSDSDFEECIYYSTAIACYGTRASMYGVGGIPHTQWNGIEETVGGYGNANWEPMYNTFVGMYNSVVGQDTPYDININGMFENDEVSYAITVSMDANHSAQNRKLEIIVVEDKIWSYWGSVSQYHNARNVGRHWISSEDLTISSEGDEQVFSGTFSVDLDSWNPDSVKMIALVQDYNTYEVYQASQQNINEFDTDQDGIMNSQDNCMDDYNPNQEDIDGDGMGDVCDACDNLNIYFSGNTSGDFDLDGFSQVDIFDVITLSDIVDSGDTESCGYEAGDLTGEGNVTIIDVIALASFIIQGAF